MLLLPVDLLLPVPFYQRPFALALDSCLCFQLFLALLLTSPIAQLRSMSQPNRVLLVGLQDSDSTESSFCSLDFQKLLAGIPAPFFCSATLQHPLNQFLILNSPLLNAWYDFCLPIWTSINVEQQFPNFICIISLNLTTSFPLWVLEYMTRM